MDKEYEITDSQLVVMIRENNEDAKDCMYQRYSPLIHKEIHRVKSLANNLNIDMADLAQEAMLAFSNAINEFDDSQETKFITFVTLCIRRRLKNYISKYLTGKHFAFNNAIRIDNTEGEYNLLSFLKEPDNSDPLHKMITQEQLENIKIGLSRLSKREREALICIVSGLNIDDTGDIMNLSSKQVYNLIFRARSKLKEFI